MMMIPGFFTYTKSKIIISYILLLLLSVAAIFFIYRQTTHMLEDDPGVGQINRKLITISNVISKLYEAETLGNAYLQTGADSTFRKHIHLMVQVNNNIDSLRRMSQEPDQKVRLDTVSMLLARKSESLQALIKAREALQPNEFYRQAIATIESGRDSNHVVPTVHPKVTTLRDSTYVKSKKKRKGLWAWLSPKKKQDSVLQITTAEHLLLDSLVATGSQNTDTVVNLLKSVWQNVQEQQEQIVRRINRTEYKTTAQSAYITTQLQRILYEYEHEEINYSFMKLGQNKQAVNRIIYTIAWIAILAFVLILAFSFFILRDITRSQHYRRKLEAANQYAGQLLRAREKMILNVTHDIKSPLGSILGYIELLGTMPVNERQRYFLKNMQGSSEHILRLVTNLLDLSKLESNKMVVEEVIFNPMRLFHEVCDTFIPLAARKQLVLECHIDSALDCGCQSDALRIRQIITNILSNAVKYTEQGTVRFSADRTDTRIILRISDTGPGMTPAEQQTVFEEFTRLTPHAAIEGTGIGLTITLKLIHLLAGTIQLESTPGKGSCFTITLPFAAATEESVLVSKPLPEPASESQSISRPIRILLVDDDPLQLEMTSGLLQNHGLQTDMTTRPDEVATRLQGVQYDLLISDIQMPGIDGFQLVQTIRALPNPIAGIPVIALSANSEKEESDYLKAGFSAYLSKPFTSTQLLTLVARLTSTPLPAVTPPAKPQPQTSTHGYTLANIMQFTDNDPAATDHILRSFISETKRHLALLSTYRQEGQWLALFKLAHKMLPLFRQLEAHAIVTSLQRLEQGITHPIPEEEATELVNKVIEKTGQLVVAISASLPHG